MGSRWRLRAGYDISPYSPQAQVILKALRTYGMFLADIGNDWGLSGTLDARWAPDLMSELRRVPASAFEAVDESSLRLDVNSARARA
jgi:hypothetical protein